MRLLNKKISIKLVLLFLVTFVSVNLFAQSKNYVLLGNYLTNKTKKVMLNQNYNVVLSDAFLSKMDNDFVKQYKEKGFFNAKLTMANLKNFYFNGSLEIPFNEILSIEERGKSFYIRSTVLMIGLATFGVINYSLLLNNSSFYVYALVNIFSGVLPVNIVMLSTNLKNGIDLRNHEILEVRNFSKIN